MTDKEFRRLKRSELIDIIYEYQKREEELREELQGTEQRLGEEIQLLRTQLEERSIKIANAGSIAEAAMSMNEIWETTQQTADQYLASIQALKEETEKQCANELKVAKRQAYWIISKAEQIAADRFGVTVVKRHSSDITKEQQEKYAGEKETP